MTFRRLVLAAVTTGAVLGSQPAAAQEPGVTIDPDSPAGKEYQIPLETAPPAEPKPKPDPKPEPKPEPRSEPAPSSPQPSAESSPAPATPVTPSEPATSAPSPDTSSPQEPSSGDDAGASGARTKKGKDEDKAGKGSGGARDAEREEPTSTADDTSSTVDGQQVAAAGDSGDSDGGSAGALVVGLAVATLCLGGVAGLVLRHRRRTA